MSDPDINDLLQACLLQEAAEDFNANDCDECGGEGVPELCPKCVPLFDDARVARRNAIAAWNSRPSEDEREWPDLAEDDPLIAGTAAAIAEHGFGRTWSDFHPTNAYDTDQGDLIEYARAACGFILARLRSPAPPEDAAGAAARQVGEFIYERISKLIDAKPGTPEEAELQYLAIIVSYVEEYDARGDQDREPMRSPAPEWRPISKTDQSRELLCWFPEKVGRGALSAMIRWGRPDAFPNRPPTMVMDITPPAASTQEGAE